MASHTSLVLSIVHAWFSLRRIRIDVLPQSDALFCNSTGNRMVIREQAYEEMTFLYLLMHLHNDLPNII